MFEKIWKDPVWSKVISVIIVAIGSIIYAKITSIYEDKTFKDSFLSIINFKIRLIYIIFFIILFWISRWILKKLFLSKKSTNTNSTNKEKLRNVNKTIDRQEGIIMKWNVHFDTYGKPFVSDVNCFCTLHGDLPLKFMYNKCPNINCKNSKKELNEYAIENIAESIVLNEWDKINGTKIQ